MRDRISLKFTLFWDKIKVKNRDIGLYDVSKIEKRKKLGYLFDYKE